MKRNLLTLVFITLVSLTAGAQAVCKSHKELPKRIDSEIVDIDPALFKTQRIQSAPVCKAMDDDSYLSKQKHLCVNGADSPYMQIGIGDNLSAVVMGRLTPEMLKPYAGYKIVGISFAVGSTLGDSPGIIFYELDYDGWRQMGRSDFKDYYTVPSMFNEVECTWNYVIPEEPNAIMFGYTFDPIHLFMNETNDNVVVVGRTTDLDNGFLVWGELIKGEGSKLYRLSTDELPYAACVQLILSNGSSTEIVGVDGKRNVKVVERYTPDGQRVSAPVSGINIEKLSDGTTRKVFVKK
ncbi:hypothetical protein [Prevotella sp.]|uniref:hypothetical protein n=1 Tax=Prevotella sp. TaxID=59823 RepID=UPI00307C6523